MYEDLRSAVDWEQKLPIIAREFGQNLAKRSPLLLFGPRYLTYLFSPQARILEASLRKFGTVHSNNLPVQWQNQWPGRDQERLYLLLERIENSDKFLRSESRSENSKAGIYHWHAGPVEMDLILPNASSIGQMDPRVQVFDTLDSLAIARIGVSEERPILSNLSLAEAIRSTQQAVNEVREALGLKTAGNLSEPQPSQVLNPGSAKESDKPKRDVWIKA